jgi:hypothetical protein
MPVLHPNPIADTRQPRDNRDIGELMSGFLSALQGEEGGEDLRASILGNPEREKETVKAYVKRNMDLRIGKGIAKGDLERLGKAQFSARDITEGTGELYVPGGGRIGPFGPKDLALLAELHPDAVREAQTEWHEEQKISPKRVAELEVTEFETEEAKAEAERIQATRTRDVMRYLDENLPTDVEGRTLVLQAENAYREAGIAETVIGVREGLIGDLSKLVASLTPRERAFLQIAQEGVGGQYLAQAWLQEEAFDFNVRLKALGDTQTRAEAIRERFELRRDLSKEISSRISVLRRRDPTTGKEIEGDLTNDELLQGLALVHADVRDLSAIDPVAGVIQYDAVRGLFGGIKDFDAVFAPLENQFLGTINKAATTLANDPSYKLGDRTHPLWAEIEESLTYYLTDPLTGADQAEAVRKVIETKAGELMSGGDTSERVTQAAILRYKLAEASTAEIRQRELARIEEEYRVAREVYDANNEELAKGNLSAVAHWLKAEFNLRMAQLSLSMTRNLERPTGTSVSAGLPAPGGR